MARGGNSILPGGIYHVRPRFVAHDFIIESAVERAAYLWLLARALVKTDWVCFAYAAMSSHLHLALVAGTMPMRAWLRPMHNQFADWINERRQRIGAVFVRGPEVTQVMPNGVSRLINYLHYNPVKARLVAAPADSDWTSHRAYVGLAKAPTWLDVDAGLALADFRDQEEFSAWAAATQTTREELKEREYRAVRGQPKRMPMRTHDAERMLKRVRTVSSIDVATGRVAIGKR